MIPKDGPALRRLGHRHGVDYVRRGLPRMMILEDDAGGGGEGDEKVLLSRLVVIRRHVPR